ncbi:hypothetical protein HZC08_01005, partial [Candidatus Micrarchaeota archaeon]|nr:hypothetical protein [Candidatus Micrarchaeota archaeon]
MRFESNRLFVCFTLLLFLFLAGCTAETSVGNSTKPDNILSSSEQDLDGDGTSDVYYYSFSTTSVDQITVKRYLLASAEKEISGTGSAEDFSVAFEQFKTLKDEAELSCNQDLGLAGVRCLDVKTCSKLCASNSQACKSLVEKYGDTPSFYILQYIKDSIEISKTSDSVTSLLNKFDTLE